MSKKTTTRASHLRLISDKTFRVSAPFSFMTTVRKPSHFPTPLEGFPDDNTYEVAAEIDRQLYGLRASLQSANAVNISVYGDPKAESSDPEALTAEFARRLGLLTDLSGFRSIWKRDKLLSTLDPELAGGRPAMPHSLYGFLMICVFLQNTQVRRTVQMVNTMLEQFGRSVCFPDGTVLPALWTPEAILSSSESELRDLRIGYRAKTVLRLSEQFASHPDLGDRLLLISDPQQLRKELGTLYGVGPATTGYVSFEWFKNLDDLAHVSPWETKILGQLLFDREASPDEVMAAARTRWAPYTMLALHGLFESVFWKRVRGEGPTWLDDLILL